MKIPSYGGNGQLATNMTPMIDVVFLLIIFFLVSSHLAQQENELPLPLPTAISGEESRQDAHRITLNLLGSGEIMLAGKPVRLSQLAERLSQAVSRVGQDVEVRIRADRQVAYQHVAPVLNAAARSGIWNVTFAVLERRSS